MRAWALLVVSSEGQRENLSDYHALATADAERQGWTLERMDDFRAVASGKDGVRAPMLALVAAITSLPVPQRPSWVWMRRVDRVGRGRATESMLALYSLHDLGVRIWDHDTGEVRLDTAEGELPAMLKAWFGRLDNEIRSSKALSKYAQKRAAGLTIGNYRPYGLTLRDGKDVAVPELAEVVRLAFTLRLEGLGYKAIAKRVADLAPPSISARTGNARNLAWSPQAVRRLLTNRAYIGTIVDEFTFRRAQQMAEQLRNRGDDRTRKHPWPLAGAIRCYCGSMLIGEPSKPKNTVFRYYACRARHPLPRPRHRAETLEEQFVTLLRRFDAEPGLVTSARDDGVSPELLRSALKVANAALADVDRRQALVWDDRESGLIRREDVQTRLDAIAGQRRDAVERVASLEGQILDAAQNERSAAGVLDLVREAVAIYETADDEHQRRIARTISAAVGGLYVTSEHALCYGRERMERSV